MTAPKSGQHEYVVSWHPSDVAKALLALLVGFIIAVVGIVQVILAGGWSVGGLTLAIVGALLPITTYNGAYHAKWFLSMKTYLNAAVVILTALAPVLVTYWTGNGWHNLTGAGWIGFTVAALGAFGIGVVPNTTPAAIPAGWGPSDEPAVVHDVNGNLIPPGADGITTLRS